MQSSRLHAKVSQILKSAGVAHENEKTLLGGLVVDICLPNLVLEIQGPTHYLANLETGQTELKGASHWKEALLAQTGWVVRRVFHEDLKNKSQEEARRWLQSVIFP